jgi:hypothetical protein
LSPFDTHRRILQRSAEVGNYSLQPQNASSMLVGSRVEMVDPGSD